MRHGDGWRYHRWRAAVTSAGIVALLLRLLQMTATNELLGDPGVDYAETFA